MGSDVKLEDFPVLEAVVLEVRGESETDPVKLGGRGAIRPPPFSKLIRETLIKGLIKTSFIIQPAPFDFQIFCRL